MFRFADELLVMEDDFDHLLNLAIEKMSENKDSSAFSHLTLLLKSSQLTREQFKRLDNAVLEYGSNTDDSFWIVDVGTHYKERLASIMASNNWLIMCINMLDAYLYRNADDPQRCGDEDVILQWIYQCVHERIMININSLIDVRSIMLLERWMQFGYRVVELKGHMVSAGIARDYCYNITEISWFNNNFEKHYADCLRNFYGDLDNYAQIGVMV